MSSASLLSTLQTYCDFVPSLRRKKPALSPSLFLSRRLPRGSAEFCPYNLSLSLSAVVAIQKCGVVRVTVHIDDTGEQQHPVIGHERPFAPLGFPYPPASFQSREQLPQPLRSEIHLIGQYGIIRLEVLRTVSKEVVRPFRFNSSNLACRASIISRFIIGCTSKFLRPLRI